MFYRALLGFIGFYWVFLVSIRFFYGLNWVLQGFTGGYWFPLGFHGFFY